MSKKQANAVPASLIAQIGTGPDTKGLIGKRIRVTNAPSVDPILMILMGIEGDPVPAGAEGKIFHIAADGAFWVDFSDSPVKTLGQGPNNQPFWDIGHVDDEDGKTTVPGLEYEFIA